MSECGAGCQGKEDNFRRNSSAKQRFTIPESSITLPESAPNFRDEFAVDSPLQRRVCELSVPERDDLVNSPGAGGWTGQPALRDALSALSSRPRLRSLRNQRTPLLFRGCEETGDRRRPRRSDVGQPAGSVILQIEEPVGIVDWFFAPGRRDRLDARKCHPGRYALSCR